MPIRYIETAVLCAAALCFSTTSRAQSAEEIFEGAKTLSDELEIARKQRDTDSVCRLALTINAEHLASRRLMMQSAERAFTGFDADPTDEEASRMGTELGGYLAVTDVLAKLSGRAEMACEMLSHARR